MLYRIYNLTKSSFLLFLSISTVGIVEASRYGRWIECNEDASRYYSTLQEYISKEHINRPRDVNLLFVQKDSDSSSFFTIISGMFPFSKSPNPLVKELIDFLCPETSMSTKRLNKILSDLAALKVAIVDGRADDIKSLSGSILRTLAADSSLLTETTIRIDLEGNLKLATEKGKGFGVKSYTNAIEKCLLRCYLKYVEALEEYFKAAQFASAEDKRLASSSRMSISEVRKKIDNAIVCQSNCCSFTDIVASLQSAQTFTKTAHKLVHTENILLYADDKKMLKIPNDGIRFFTLNDMCENCENIVWSLANDVKFNKNQFLVLSNIEYKGSRNRNNTEECFLFKIPLEEIIFKK